jgi:putative endonuclease
MGFYVYMLASQRNGTLYIGMTDNLIQRVWMHKNEVMPGFTKQYGVKVLVWYEQHETREAALVRERQMKKWNRAWKLRLIQETNPQWIRSLRGLVALSSGSPPSRGRTVAV